MFLYFPKKSRAPRHRLRPESWITCKTRNLYINDIKYWWFLTLKSHFHHLFIHIETYNFYVFCLIVFVENL